MKYNFDEIINRENTNSIKWDFRKDIFGKADVIPLWVADMDFRTPDFILNAIRERAQHEILGYTYHSESFFGAARDWLLRRNGWQTDIKDMAFSPGIVPALSFAVKAFTNKGDTILIQPPTYMPFFSVISEHKRTMLSNPLIETDGYYEIDFDDFEQKLAGGVKLFIFCNPHNPVGRVWTKDELLKIGNLCVKYNVKIISDEIHSDLIFKPNKHIHLASLSNEIAQQTLTCIAPSKTFNLAGLSSSIVHSVNPDILNTFNSCIKLYHADMGNLFGNVALETAYKQGDDWLEQLLEYIEGNIDWVKSYLDKNIPQISVWKTEGTYFMWLNFKKLNLSQTKLNNFLINNAGLGLNDGVSFGKNGYGFMRLNTACPRALLQKAMQQLKSAVDLLIC